MGMTQNKLPRREGFIYGSVATPLFDFYRRMKQGDQRLLAWPLKKIDERFICMTECYRYKRPDDIKKNFINNLDIVIQLPKYHTEVLWDLGENQSVGSNFVLQQ